MKEKALFVSHSLCIEFSFPVCCHCQQKDEGSKNQTKIKKLTICWFSIHIIPYKKKTANHYFSETTCTYVYHLLIY